MANALKKITTRAKQLKKRNPGKKWKTLVKQAGAEYRSGKLKTTRKRKPAAKKRKPVRRKPARRRVSSASAVGTVKRRRVRRRRVARKACRVTTRVRTRTRTKTVYRRVGSKKSKLGSLLLIGGALAVGYLLLKPKPAPVQYIPTNNPTRNNLASDIISIVTAAGMTATQIVNLIKNLNSSNDAQVQQIYDNVKSGVDPYANVAGFGYGKQAVSLMQ